MRIKGQQWSSKQKWVKSEEIETQVDPEGVQWGRHTPFDSCSAGSALSQPDCPMQCQAGLEGEQERSKLVKGKLDEEQAMRCIGDRTAIVWGPLLAPGPSLYQRRL